MMQQARKGEVVPVGAAPGWGPRRRRFSGGVVQTGKPPMTSAIAIHEATRDTEPKVGNYVTSHTAAGAEAPSAESDPQVYSKWLATRNDGGAGYDNALAERARAEQAAAQLAAEKTVGAREFPRPPKKFLRKAYQGIRAASSRMPMVKTLLHGVASDLHLEEAALLGQVLH